MCSVQGNAIKTEGMFESSLQQFLQFCRQLGLIETKESALKSSDV